MDFNIEWYRGNQPHAEGDSGSFDGPGSVLAHAFFPRESADPGIFGDAHFDGDEDFTDNTPEGE